MKEQYSQEVRDIVAGFTFMDDELMSAAFNNNIPATQLVIRIILGRDDLVVKTARTQESFANLKGHDLKLDILATDADGKLYNIEVQNDSSGASAQRARYHSSILDANNLPTGEDFKGLPETYVIFITRDDVLHRNLPIYHVNRIIEEDGTQFGDGAHIIYVNGRCQDNTDLGKLMQDFHSAQAQKMHYPVLQDLMKQYKENDEEDNTMCAAVEAYARKRLDEGRNEGLNEGLLRGRNEGLNEGLLRGRAEGLLRGRDEGLSEGLLRGRSEGRTEGEAQGQLKTIKALLELKIITPEQAATVTNLSLSDARRIAASLEQ